MLASQLIYTSWKNINSTNKGYRVYSKSTDISPEETEEILNAMHYDSPAGTPYAPTPEEVATLFPVMSSYFMLSSGRACIAQSTYIGQDYTGRWGNYIIHAYVLDSLGDTRPCDFIGSGIFRRQLTDAELNIDHEPAPLPRVDISGACSSLGQSTISAFLSQDNRAVKLAELAETVMANLNTPNRISFYDDIKNAPLWIAALSLILPESAISKLSFATYEKGVGGYYKFSCPVRDPSNPGVQYTPGVVNVEASALGSNQQSAYYLEMARLVCKDKDLARHFGAKIEQWTGRDSTLTPDQAAAIVSLEEGSLPQGQPLHTTHELLRRYISYGTPTVATVCRDMFDRHAGSATDNDPDAVEFYKTIYSGVDSAYRERLVKHCMKLAMAGGRDAKDICDRMKSYTPCSLGAFLKYLADGGLSKAYALADSLTKRVALAYLSMDVYEVADYTARATIIDDIVDLLCDPSVSTDDSMIKSILERSKSCSDNAFDKIYSTWTSRNLQRLAGDPNRLFNYLGYSQDKPASYWGLLFGAIDTNPTIYDHCVGLYYNKVQADPALRSTLESGAASNPRAGEFLSRVSVLECGNAECGSYEQLVDMYNKLVRSIQQGGNLEKQAFDIFVRKMKQYFQSLSEKKLRASASDFFNHVLRNSPPSANTKYILLTIIDKLFGKLPFEAVCEQLGQMNKGEINNLVSTDADRVVSQSTVMKLYLANEGFAMENAVKKFGHGGGIETLHEAAKLGRLNFQNPNIPDTLKQEFFEVFAPTLLNMVYCLSTVPGTGTTPAQIMDLYIWYFVFHRNIEKILVSAMKKDARLTFRNRGVFEFYLSHGEFRSNMILKRAIKKYNAWRLPSKRLKEQVTRMEPNTKPKHPGDDRMIITEREQAYNQLNKKNRRF